MGAYCRIREVDWFLKKPAPRTEDDRGTTWRDARHAGIFAATWVRRASGAGFCRTGRASLPGNSVFARCGCASWPRAFELLVLPRAFRNCSSSRRWALVSAWQEKRHQGSSISLPHFVGARFVRPANRRRFREAGRAFPPRCKIRSRAEYGGASTRRNFSHARAEIFALGRARLIALGRGISAHRIYFQRTN